jgi:serine/threonine protein kinase
MQELLGMKIGPYQIQRHLARGGMANIYLARSGETGVESLVAIKLVHTRSGEYYERFRRETQEHSPLQHDHILPVLAYGEFNSWCYLITPYIAGGTLTSRLNDGPLSVQDVTEIFSQLAGALQYAHEQGIIHRDIKPSNILMRDEHYAYLADFGLVEHVGLDASLRASGSLMGTPQYMAPELAEGEASPRSDIYALGILLYKMLTGQVPFNGTSSLAVYLKHFQEQPVTPTVLNPAIPPEIGRFVLCALAKDPDDRYQTAQDFNIAYQQALAQVHVRWLGGVEVALLLSYTRLAVPQIKRGDQQQPNGLQRHKATRSRGQKQVPGSVVLKVALVSLLLSLFSTSALQPSSRELATQPPIQATHSKGDSTPQLSPAPPMVPTPQPVDIQQQMGASTSQNGKGGKSSGSDDEQGKGEDGSSHGNRGYDHDGASLHTTACFREISRVAFETREALRVSSFEKWKPKNLCIATHNILMLGKVHNTWQEASKNFRVELRMPCQVL